MNKEDILKRSREENRNGDEWEKLKSETALNKGYLTATYCLIALASSCYLGFTSGSVVIHDIKFQLSDILWFIIFLTSLVEFAYKYIYLNKKKHLFLAIFYLCACIAAIICMFRH